MYLFPKTGKNHEKSKKHFFACQMDLRTKVNDSKKNVGTHRVNIKLLATVMTDMKKNCLKKFFEPCRSAIKVGGLIKEDRQTREREKKKELNAGTHMTST